MTEEALKEMFVADVRNNYSFPSLYSLDPRTATVVDVERCLEAGADINEKDKSGSDFKNVVNYYAYVSDNVQVVDYLCEHGAVPDSEIFSYGIGILLSSVDSMEMFDILLKHGVDINDQDCEGENALEDLI